MENYQWIDNIILGLKDLSQTDNVYELYDFLNIKTQKLPKNNILLHQNEAFYYRNYCDGEIVFIVENLEPYYEKFILAHELAHALIHVDIYEAAFNKSLLNVGKLERQANYFALKLLNINLFDETFEELSLEQIAKLLHLPMNCLLSILE